MPSASTFGTALATCRPSPPATILILAGAHCPCWGQFVSGLFRCGASPLFLFPWYPEAPVTSPGWMQPSGRDLSWGSVEAEAPQPMARTKISPLLRSTDPNGGIVHRPKPFTCYIYNSNKLASAPAPPASQDPRKAVQSVWFMFLPQPGSSSLLQ